MTAPRRTDGGAITALVAVLAVGLLFVAGLAYDGGQVIAAQTEARSDAAKAARAAAQEIDIDALRQGRPLTLDPAAAVAAGEAYLDRVGASGAVSVDGDTVSVTVTVVQPMVMLPLPDRVVIASDEATATDAPTTGGARS